MQLFLLILIKDIPISLRKFFKDVFIADSERSGFYTLERMRRPEMLAFGIRH